MARVLPWLRKIPNFFRSPVGRKVASTLAKAGMTTGANIVADRVAKRPWKEIRKQRGKEAAIDLLGRAKAGLEGSGRRRRRKQIKGLTGLGRRTVRGKKQQRRSSRRLRRSVRKKDIFD